MDYQLVPSIQIHHGKNGEQLLVMKGDIEYSDIKEYLSINTVIANYTNKFCIILNKAPYVS